MTTRASTDVSSRADHRPGRGRREERAPHGRRGASPTSILLAVAAAILCRSSTPSSVASRTNGQLAANPVALIPDPWVFDNYADVLWGENAPAFWGELFNSVIVAIVAVGVTVGCASAAAFVFARMRFPGREAMYTLFVFGLLFPIGCRDPAAVCPDPPGRDCRATCWGSRSRRPPSDCRCRSSSCARSSGASRSELEDAARIDGCGSFGFFWRVLLPLSRPALATVSVLAIVTTWNAFILPLVVLNSADQWTLPLGVMNFASTYSSDAARTLAFTVVSLIPALIFYIIAERHIVGGLTAGAVKG